MKDKDGAISRGQLDNCFVQREPIKHGHVRQNVSTFNYSLRQFTVFGQLLSSPATLAKVHQHMINGQAVQPSGESAFPAKGSQLAKNLDEDLLRKIFRLRSIPSHPQAHAIYPSMMELEEFLER